MLLDHAQVNAIPKHADEDSVLTTRNAAGEKINVPCPKGTYLVLHTPGLHYNRTSSCHLAWVLLTHAPH